MNRWGSFPSTRFPVEHRVHFPFPAFDHSGRLVPVPGMRAAGSVRHPPGLLPSDCHLCHATRHYRGIRFAGGRFRVFLSLGWRAGRHRHCGFSSQLCGAELVARAAGGSALAHGVFAAEGGGEFRGLIQGLVEGGERLDDLATWRLVRGGFGNGEWKRGAGGSEEGEGVFGGGWGRGSGRSGHF